jgi:lipoprotein-anchoring transpeptidase ErfK/SrfK
VRRAATLSAAALASVAVLASAGIALMHAGASSKARLDASASMPRSSAHQVLASAQGASGNGGTRVAGLAKSAGTSRTVGKSGGTAKPGSIAKSGSSASGSTAPSLTSAERQSCPTAAAACVDLTAHLTWLQSGGKVTFGPLRMEPGAPGTPNATPRGTFRVQWKAGPNYISDEYNEAMPWATFFAPGGIAFHGGSLTKPSHGCVHLTVANAHYYHDHLPIGAEVVVF